MDLSGPMPVCSFLAGVFIVKMPAPNLTTITKRVITMTFSRTLALLGGLATSVSAFSMSSAPAAAPVDPIQDFANSWAGKALAHQRNIELNTPLADSNIIGSHNSYNSTTYRNVLRYHDPQQKHSIYDQLRLGARFIELDAHWTAQTHGAPWTWGPDLLLCHSGIGVDAGDLHLGCSLTDRFVKDGLQEVADFLNANPQEVIILYFEDHTEGHHQELLNLINEKLGGKVYASNGCRAIPNNLTRAQVRAAGKQVVLWKDGGCSSNSGMANLAYTSLGGISRIWEDRTNIAAIGGFFTGDTATKLDAADIAAEFQKRP